MIRPRLALFSILLCLTLAGPLAAAKTLAGIPLEWKPTSEVGDFDTLELTGLVDKKIRVGAFTDGREVEDPTLIAENREDADEGKILPVTTGDDVAAWVGEHAGTTLRLFGLSTTAEGGDAVLTGEVRRFFVTETNVYESDVAFLVTLARPDGEVLWQGLATGSATRFGRSYKDENYYEVLSDALMEAVHGLVANPGFQDALRGL